MILALWVMIGFLCLYGAVVFTLAHLYIHPKVPTPATPDSLKELTITIGNDRVPLWVSPQVTDSSCKPNLVFLMIHGYRGDRSSWKEAAHDLVQKGYTVVIPEMPGHGAHSDSRCGFVQKESRLILQLTEWIRNRWGKDVRIVLIGISMGGAASWIASESDPDLFAVITEGAIVHLDATTDRWLDRTIPKGRILLAPVKWLASYITGIDPKQLDVLASARKWRGKRALVIQGERDRLIPLSDTRELAEVVGCELWIVPDAKHAHCYRQARKMYLARVLEICEEASPS